MDANQKNKTRSIVRLRLPVFPELRCFESHGKLIDATHL